MNTMSAALPSADLHGQALVSLAGETITALDLATASILRCSPETTVVQAARLILNARATAVFVVEQGRPVGVWSERSALQIDLDCPDQMHRPVRELMSPNVVVVPGDATLHELSQKFLQARACHVLVENQDGDIVGAVSQADVALHQGINNYLRLRTVESMIQRALVAVDENTPAAKVMKTIRKAHVDSAAVRYADGSWGIITSQDIIGKVLNERDGQQAAGEIASRPVVTVPLAESALVARNLLIAHEFRHVGVHDEHNNLVGILTLSDILGSMEQSYVVVLQQHARDLSATQRHMLLAQQVINSTLEGIIITDLESRIISVNPAFTEITGYSKEEVIGRTPAILSAGHHPPEFYREMWQEIHQNGFWRGEIFNKKKNGTNFVQLLTITALRDSRGRTINYAATFSDITAQRKSEEKIRQLAYYDALTGLPNRRFIERRIEAGITRVGQDQKLRALLFIDLDDFKRINDSLGHAVGDLFLRTVAERLQSVMRSDDTIARMGGDEFIALLTDIGTPEEAVLVARRMLGVLRTPIKHEGHQLMVSCSIGISIYPQDGINAETLISRADTAMYRAKKSGRNAIQMYTDAMSLESKSQLEMESALYKALAENEFELYYQPVMDLATERVVACEALIRWRRFGLELVSPDQFLPLAEELNLMVEITDWVMATGLRQLAEWHKTGHADLKLSLNMASKAFFDDGFVTKLENGLALGGVDPSQVILELTERMLMDDKEVTVSRLNLVREMGVQVALDDFGTGWSSLTHLHSYPLDVLKIDREFVDNVDDLSSKEASIVGAIVMLTKSMGLKVVAEGVESLEQKETLRDLGCNLLQGYYYSRPVPAAEMTRLLHDTNFVA